MKKETGTKASRILPVPRTREEARQFYDRISKVYDFFTAAFERKYAEMALERLSVQKGETVLESGFGTGHCLKRIAESAGRTGKACAVDISPGMLAVTRRRLDKASIAPDHETAKGTHENELLRIEWRNRQSQKKER